MASVTKRGNGLSVTVREDGEYFIFSVRGDDGTNKPDVLRVSRFAFENTVPRHLEQQWWEKDCGVFVFVEGDNTLHIGARIKDASFLKLAVVTQRELPLLGRINRRS